MKNFKLILSTTFIALLLSACGGGGGSSSDASFDSGSTNSSTEDTTVDETTTKVSIVSCSTSTYTNIEVGDLLVKQQTPTQVTIIHDSDDNKKVCVVSGSAHLLREL